MCVDCSLCKLNKCQQQEESAVSFFFHHYHTELLTFLQELVSK